MFLTRKLESMTKSIRMLNNGSDMLDEILLVGKGSKNFTRVGFNSQSLNKQGETSKKVFVSPESKTEFIMTNNMYKDPVYLQKKQNKAKFAPWKCHYCGRNGHIKPYCFELYGYPKQPLLPKSKHVEVKEWRPKVVNTCHRVHTTILVI